MPRPSLVLPVIAIFFAIGGIGYAASTIGTGDIKDGAVTKAKLHKNSVVSKKVKNHSLKCKDLKKGCLRGAAGPIGPTGPAGSAANIPLSGEHLVTAEVGTEDVVLASNEGFTYRMDCNGTEAAPETVIEVVNVSGGNNANNTGGDGTEDDDFDEGTVDEIVSASGPNESEDINDGVFIFGSSTTQWATGAVVNDPTAPRFGASAAEPTTDTDCVASLNIIAL